MLTKNPKPVAGSENGKGCGQFWAAPERSVLCSLAIIVLLPVAVAAQQGSQPGAANPMATVYGSSYQIPLEFEGERAPVEQVSLSMGVSALYDDNVLGSNSQRRGDEALSFDARLGIQRRTKHLAINFDYLPFFLLYRQISEYDRTNHAANLSLSYRLTSRVVLGLQGTFSYQNGLYPTLILAPILSGAPSPASPNGIIIPYTVRTLAGMSELYLTFMKNRRTSLTLTASYNENKYGTGKQNTGLPLYNGNGLSGGLTFEHFVSGHTSLGVLLLHQDTTYQGGLILGERQRTQIESAYLSFASQLSPSVKISLFGGPQYVRSIGLVSPEASLSGNFQSAGGGSITKQVRQTALNLSLTRSVTDGGGLYTSVIDTRAIFGVRRRLMGRWEGRFRAGAAREDTSLFRFVSGRGDGIIVGVQISRPLLTQGSVLHISYDSMHQTTSGPLPGLANFDRNQISIGFDYQLKGINIGR